MRNEQGMHWIYPSLGGAFFAFALGSFGDASLTMVIDSYRDVSSSHPVTNDFPCPSAGR